MLSDEPLYDLIFRNGTVIDGSGEPRIKADVAVQGDRIADIGHLVRGNGRREIDVSGLILAPGFIDVHTHDDAAIISRPQMLPKLTQGVTTVICGNCGISGAPYNKTGDPPDLLRLVFKSDRFVSASLEGYLRKVKDAAPATNAAFLTGHTTLRMHVMGADLGRVATASEISAMRELLRQCLAEGSLGLSTGLFYQPARAASTNEVIEVAKVLKLYGGIYTTHLRDEGDAVIESLEEALQIGRATDTPVIVSHHKCSGRKNFGRSVETLALLQNAHRHQQVAWDVYPYTAASTVLNEEMVRASVKTLITWCDPHPEFCNLNLERAADVLGCTPIEAVTKLQPAGAIYFMMDEADVTRILASSQAMIGSDGLPDDQHPHPRLWGTFPRVLGRYVRERKIMTLEDGVHRMTGLAAERFALHDRGHLAVGKFADMCVFDPQCILDSASFESPTQPAVGIHYVLVNGQMALENGTPTSRRSGRILLRH
ncbi:N-acyl-D-amino-acid deacylase [Steroidobacter agaridevorans]|uniref:N-acyl-D-amino-acid deacylase n=1 Tax=Steroidobacter agaridevorans TaxID=2695856 RepID=A0A829YJX3_9GAMM|nr:D-aminoacylase [Steroidobacter agaridevorans]GFE83704.1 N-acyl-D-amino-acid deacylase [Steroidobacter agaridevorans]